MDWMACNSQDVPLSSDSPVADPATFDSGAPGADVAGAGKAIEQPVLQSSNMQLHAVDRATISIDLGIVHRSIILRPAPS
jgi:hypothetical protein